jgi:hypothetical protein
MRGFSQEQSDERRLQSNEDVTVRRPRASANPPPVHQAQEVEVNNEAKPVPRRQHWSRRTTLQAIAVVTFIVALDVLLFGAHTVPERRDFTSATICDDIGGVDSTTSPRFDDGCDRKVKPLVFYPGMLSVADAAQRFAGFTPRPPLRVVWAFWFGDMSKMSPNRRRGMEMLKKNIGVPLRFITSMDDVRALSKPEDPIHPLVFKTDPQVLSSNHIVDYVRAYIMKHYGGGYLDVKPVVRSWAPYFDWMEKEPGVWRYSPRMANVFRPACNETFLIQAGMSPPDCYRVVRLQFGHVGNDAAWIARPYTPFAIEFYAMINATLNRKWQAALKHPVPAKFKNRCCSIWSDEMWPRYETVNRRNDTHPKYPFRWAELFNEPSDVMQIKYAGTRHLRFGLPGYDMNAAYL